jgi:hypothetical protein
MLRKYKQDDARDLVRDFLRKHPDLRQHLNFFLTDALRGFDP